MQRFRILYSKGEELRYTGNLDMHKVWERTFRRADFKLAYSQGFHPQPKIHQACPLPLGFSSNYELLDFWLETEEELGCIKEKLNQKIQPGISILEISIVPLESKPLQTLVRPSAYSVLVESDESSSAIADRVHSLQQQEQCIRTRRGKEYDLLPLIEKISVSTSLPVIIDMTLAARAGATGRPEEVLDALGIDLSDTDVVRTGLIFEDQ